MKKGFVVVAALCMVLASVSLSNAQLANTLHNLSATGPGTRKAPGVGQLCKFCHTPHNTLPSQALWNRDLPPKVYNLYTSSTLEATLNQPTGSSRLCLSCHDGTTAMGNMRVPPQAGPVNLSALIGPASLGTDLSDDHPISFVYDSALALKRGELADPTALGSEVRLDSTGQLQCTTCHDAHDNRNRKFLKKNDIRGVLCTTCHIRRNWTGSTHATSSSTWHGQGQNPWGDLPFTTVADRGCENCHKAHAAARPPRLLRNAQERAVCLVCHDGAATSKDIEAEFSKSSTHPIASTDWTHDPKENPNSMARHVTCADCHNPHQASATGASPPNVPGALRGVRGVNISGGAVQEAATEYEVCLKCHGITDQAASGRIVRWDTTRNVRLEINPGNPSYHPVAAVGKNTTMGNFELGYSTGSIIYCTDCHNNNQWTSTGSKPRGPHGSAYTPILERDYRRTDPSTYSRQAYDLCFKCHNENFFLNDDNSKPFNHKEHLQGDDIGCPACHDAHGSRQNPGLINFMRFDPTGRAVVTPASGRSAPEFISLGPTTKRCYLVCHGRDHNPLTYPD